MMRRNRQRGQVTVEYALLFGLVIAGLVALGVYLQRAAQGGLKGSADSLGTQFSATAPWQMHTKSQTIEGDGFVGQQSNSVSCQEVDKSKTAAACTAGAATAPITAVTGP